MRSNAAPGSWATLLIVGVLSMLALAAHSQIFPVRLDDEPDLGGLPVITSEAQILDPYVQRITNPASPGDRVTETVSTQAIASYCGDRDGCTLRLFVADAGSALDRAQFVRLFSVNASGNLWKVRDLDGASLGSGSVTDAFSEIILELHDGFDFSCGFVDSASPFEYQLQVVSPLAGTAHDCLLRVDD